MIYLLDANVLIALAISEHEHHDQADAWFAGVDSVALCPVVEGALVRYLLRVGERSETAASLLERFGAHPKCRFWAGNISYREVDLRGLQGHRQVTDTYLAALAQHHGGRLATFDTALVARLPTSTELVA